jgi:hypothetical protein
VQHTVGFLAGQVGPDAGCAWEQLIDRVGGPLTFRFVVQPAVAGALALRAGVEVARRGRPAYFWGLFTDPERRVESLREGRRAIAGVFLLAIALDAIYQIMVLRWVYISEALFLGVLLAVVPYLLVRGPVNRILRLFLHKNTASRGQAKDKPSYE